MSIQTLSEERNGAKVVARVRITDETGSRYSYEFACESCDVFYVGLSQTEAGLEMETHVCAEKGGDDG